jgi:hypothetical protein
MVTKSPELTVKCFINAVYKKMERENCDGNVFPVCAVCRRPIA